MTIEQICLTVTGKPVGTYIDNGFYCVTSAQATKLCGGKLPKPGYEKAMMIQDGKPAPSFSLGTDQYKISRTYVKHRTDILVGDHWSIRLVGTQ